MIAPEWQSVRHILVLRLDNLGDVILASPAIASLARALPQARITLLASPSGAQAGELHPDIDEVIVYEAPWVDPWQRIPHDPAREQVMIARLREMNIDAAVIFTSYRQSCLPAAYMCYLADIPLRLGISQEASGSLLTTRHRPSTVLIHEVKRGLDLIGAIGVPASTSDLVLSVPITATEAVDRWVIERLQGDGRGALIVVHPGCTMPARTYPWERYADVVTGLVERMGATVILTGTAPEQALVDQIVDRLPSGVRNAVQLQVGDQPLGRFAALVARADLLITNNTGPMHVAAAVGTPSVVLFALTNPPEQWRPWRTPHRLLFE
ncbi:MAG: glycosyltransferase family 9 protein, partial [Thermomicrobiales bacterium]